MFFVVEKCLPVTACSARGSLLRVRRQRVALHFRAPVQRIPVVDTALLNPFFFKRCPPYVYSESLCVDTALLNQYIMIHSLYSDLKLNFTTCVCTLQTRYRRPRVDELCL